MDSRSWMGESFTIVLIKAWNNLPVTARDCEEKSEMKNILKVLAFNFLE